MRLSQRAYLSVFLAILLWASAPAALKLLVQDLNNIQVMFYTFLFALLGLALLILVQRKLPLFRRYAVKDYLRMAGLGTIGCYLYALFFFGSLMYAPAQEAFAVNYLWPVMVVLFAALFLKERLTPWKLGCLALSFLGVVVVVTQGNLGSLAVLHPTADLLALAGAVSYGLFSVLAKKYKYERATALFLYYLSGFLLVLPTVFFFSSIPRLTLLQWVGVAWVGLATNALGYVFWFKALEKGDTSKMATMVFLTPFVSLVYIFVLVGESIFLSSVVGLLLIASGVLLQSFRRG